MRLDDDDMAARFRTSDDPRRIPSSSMPARIENRPPPSSLPCRNGPQCRKNLEGHCPYNHNFASMAPNGFSAPRKSLNVDSPTFTPSAGNTPPVKPVGISARSVAAPSFTPRGSGSSTPAAGFHSKESSGELVLNTFHAPQQFHEFVPSNNFVPQPQYEQSPPVQTPLNPYNDPFLSPQSVSQAISNLDGGQAAINPYVTHSTQPTNGQTFYSEAKNDRHPLIYHHYASVGPRRDNLQPYQRASSDFFIPDNLREELQRKSEAALQTYANSTLPQIVAHYHSLVALDTNQKASSVFGYPSSVYRATSTNDGHIYALRRLEGFKLSADIPFKSIVSAWKRVNNASVVKLHEAFTDANRHFNGFSLIAVTDYHPLSQTLADKHFHQNRHAAPNRTGAQAVPEQELWGYIVQLANALKSIHDNGLAAQVMTPSKVLITSKNRLRLNGCAVMDLIRHGQKRPTHELQRADLQDLGKLILDVAIRNPSAHQNIERSLQLLSRQPYSERLRDCVTWLLTPLLQPLDQAALLADYNATAFLQTIADKVISTFDSALHQEDELTSHLTRELENSRLVRLLTKLNVILERPESSLAPGATVNPALANQPSSAWSETGERYFLKLFRDYVFHQVDHEGRPVLDLGHILACLNKLDAGIDENIQLVSQNEQDEFIVSYKEVKRGFESAWAELSRMSNPSRR